VALVCALVVLAVTAVGLGTAEDAGSGVAGTEGGRAPTDAERAAVLAFEEFRKREGPMHKWGGTVTAEFLRALRVDVPEEVIEAVSDGRYDVDKVFDVFVNNPTTSEKASEFEALMDDAAEARVRSALRAVRRWVLLGREDMSFWEVRGVDALSTFDTSVVGLFAVPRVTVVGLSMVHAGGAETVLRTDGQDPGLLGAAVAYILRDSSWATAANAVFYWTNWIVWPYAQALFSLYRFYDTDPNVFLAGVLPLLTRQHGDWSTIASLLGFAKDQGFRATLILQLRYTVMGIVVTLLYSLVCSVLRSVLHADFFVDLLLYAAVISLNLGAINYTYCKMHAFFDVEDKKTN
jgi:hypothetical protein